MKRYLNTLFPRTAAAGPSASSDAAGLHRACPACGTAAAAEQDWCLECGTRLEPAGARWQQPAAVMASVALIFVAGLALALSEVAKDADIAGAKTVKKTVVAVPAPVPATSTPDAPVPTAPKAGQATNPAKVPTTSKNNTDSGPAPAATSGAGSNAGSSPDPLAGTGTSSGSTGGTGSSGSSGSGATTTPTPEPVAEWPKDKSAWTVILASTTSRADAEKLARKAKAKGIDAGIVDTGKFKDLGAGVWAVYLGQFDTEQAANNASDDYASKGFEADSVEQIKPKPKSPSKAKSGSGTTSTSTSSNGG